MKNHATSTAVRTVLVLLGIGLSASSVCAQTQHEFNFTKIQREDVPEERLADGPFQDQPWVPMDRVEFEKLLERLQPQPDGPNQPLIRFAKYSATFAKDSLVGGRLQFTIQDSQHNASSLISLGNPSFVIEELSWRDGQATWGTALNGQHWLKTRPGLNPLEGQWTARGRLLQKGTAFQLKLLPALISQFELHTPAGITLTSDVGDVVRLEHTPDDKSWAWRIDVGNATQCQFILSPISSSPEKAPVVLYDQESVVSVSNEELVLRQDLRAEVLEGELEHLTFSFPRQFKVLSVQYGDQATLPFEQETEEGPTDRIRVKLPDRMQGRLRPIRIEGMLRRLGSESLAVPLINWEGGLWLSGRVNLSVSKPWELRSYRATGYRQQMPAKGRDESEEYVFQQWDPRAQLLLDVARPSVERTAHVLNLLTASDSSWTLATEIAWESKSGTVYEATCRLPDGWQVVSVVQLGGDRELQELAGWEIQSLSDAGQILKMELAEGLTPGRVDPVRIIAHHNVLSAPLTHFPVVVPLDCESSEVLFYADVHSGGIVPRMSSADWESFNPSNATAVWNTLPAWPRVSQNKLDETRLHRFVSNQLSIPLPPESAIKQLDANVQVSVHLGEQDLTEQIQIQLYLNEPQQEIEVFTPRSASEIRWSLGHGESQTLVAKRATKTTLSAEGEAWILVFPQPMSGSLQLFGQRTKPRTAESVVPLVFVPQARRFQGRVELTSEQWDTCGLRQVSNQSPSATASDLPESVEQALLPREWSYRNWDLEWIIQTSPRRRGSDPITPLKLTTVLGNDATSFDYYQLVLSANELSGLEEFQFQIARPAQLISIVQGGQPLSVVHEQEAIVVTGWDASVAKNISIHYRIPAAAHLFGVSHTFEFPQFSQPLHEWTWDLCLPAGAELSPEPCGLQVTPRFARKDWYQKLLGPLGRSPTENLFAFWFPGSTARIPVSQREHGPVINRSHSATQEFQLPSDARIYRVHAFGLPAIKHFLVWDQDHLLQTTWLAFIAAFPLGIWLRRQRSLVVQRVSAIIICLVTCLACFGPEYTSLIFGGCASGLLLGCLVPWGFQLWSSPTVEPTSSQHRSTQVFQKAAWPLLLLLALNLGWGFTLAQEANPKVATEATVASHSPYRVLVPVDQNQQPSRKLPIVYVSPELHEKLLSLIQNEQRAPTQLIKEAVYHVYPSVNGRMELKLKYLIDLLPEDRRVELLIPLNPQWSTGLESCTVNGQPQSALLSPEGTGLVVPISDADKLEDNSPRDHYEVILQVHLPKALDALVGSYQAQVVPVLNSQLIWQSPGHVAWFDIPQARGDVSISLDRRLMEARLGAIREFDVQRGKDRESSQATARTEVTFLQLLTLHPMVTQVAFRAECKVLNGQVNQFDLKLPRGSVFRDIRGHKILQTTVLRGADDATHVVVDFLEGRAQSFVMEGEYILPFPATDQKVDYPRCEIQCGRFIGPQTNLVAIASDAGSTVQILNPNDPDVLPIQTADFVSQWGDTVPGQQPRLAFKIQEGGHPSFRMQGIQPEQQVLRFREDVTFTERRLDWEFTAELKPTSPPSYTCSLLVDPRLTLDHISLRENGTDLLLRASKTPRLGSSQNRLTLFLKSEPVGVCQLRIHGSMKIRVSSLVKIPSVQFETTQPVPGLLALYHEDGYRLELEGRQVPAESTSTFPDLLTEPHQAKLSQRLKIVEGDSRLEARLVPATGACQARTLWYLSLAAPRWTLHGRMELLPLEGTKEIQVLLPEGMQDARLVSSSGGTPPIEVLENQQRQWHIRCESEPNEPRLLEWELELPSMEDSTWRFDLPTVPQARLQENHVALSPQPEWVTDPQPSAPMTTLSQPFQEQLQEWGGEQIELLSSLTNNTLQIRRIDHQSPDGYSSITLVEHRLTGMQPGQWQGVSAFHPLPMAGMVELAIPEGVEVQGLSIDGRNQPVEPNLGSDRRWRVRNAGQQQTLEIRWQTVQGQNPGNWLTSLNVPLPRSVQENTPTILVSILPADRAGMTYWRTLPRTPRFEWCLARLDWLTKRYQRITEAGGSDPGLAQTIWREYRAAASIRADVMLKKDVSNQARQHWDAITFAVNRIAEPGINHDDLNTHHGLENLPSESSGVLFAKLTSDTNQLPYYMIRREVLIALAIVVIFVLGWWCVPWLIRLQARPWLVERQQVAWFLFGCLWWLLLSPSILGFAMMMWSVLQWFSKRRPQHVRDHSGLSTT